MEGLVSIIVPVYNCERYIEKCLKSIILQSYEKIEVLVVNDGSNDKSQQIIERIAKFDSRIYVLQQNNQGAAAARNYALESARGEYYLFVDGDDYIGIDYVKNLIDCAIKNKSELVICGYTLVYPKKVVSIKPDIYIKNKNEEWAYRISAVCSRLYSSEFWKRYNLHFTQEKNSRAEDVPLALFANAMAENICVISKSDYFYVQHELSAMHNKNAFLFPYNAFKDMYHDITERDLVNSRLFFDIGVLKFLAQFEYVLYRNVDKKEKDKFHTYIRNILKNDYERMEMDWERTKKNINFPLTHKLAISLFLRQGKNRIADK